MVITLTSQNQLKPMPEVLAMDSRSRSELYSASISRNEFIAERVMRHRTKMLDVSKQYFGLGKFQIHTLTDSSNAGCIVLPVRFT
jgi:hypothetical protein